MLTALGIIILGLGLLIVGGELLLRGAVGIATLLRLSPAVIGLTVVAAGTSVPELAVSGIAALNGKSDISVGNVVGSNIFNITVVLGLSAAYRRLLVSGNSIKLEYPVLALITLAYVIVARDGRIGRLDAMFFIATYVAFTAYMIRLVRGQVTASEEQQLNAEVDELRPGAEQSPSTWAAIGFTVSGIALLGFGADYCVDGAVRIGQFLGMSERIIGLTIVGCGTGLPEVVTSLVATHRGRNDVAIANVIGSCIFNILMILGITAIISPVPIAEAIMRYDNWWLLVVTLLMFPIMRTDFDVNRKEGYVLLSVYVVYLLSLLLS